MKKENISMTQQIIQQLAVHLKSGRTVVVPFNAEKADVLNPQIDAFFKALGDAGVGREIRTC